MSLNIEESSSWDVEDVLGDHTKLRDMSDEMLVAQLQATDNDMFYWFDPHDCEPTDVIYRLLDMLARGKTS